MKYTPLALWLLCLCASITSVIVVVLPDHARIVKKISTRSHLEAGIKTDLSLLAQSREITFRSHAARVAFVQSGVGIGTTLEIGRLLPRLQFLAQRLHIEIRSILVEPKSAAAIDGPLRARGIGLVLRGAFGQELAFLRHVTKSKGLVIRLNSASFSARAPGTDVNLKTSISLLSLPLTREGKP